MHCAFLLMLLAQAPSRYESVLWSFKSGQEFFVEETQRHLFQVKSPTVNTTYFDFTYLWRYFVVNQNTNQLKVQATLEKVRVNNANEAGAKACEAMKQHERTQSNWLLSKNESGWEVKAVPGERGPHAIPYFLTLGTVRLTDQQDKWSQQWEVPITDWGKAILTMNVTVKQRLNDRLLVTVRTKMGWPAENESNIKLSFQTHDRSIAGLGEFDFAKNRWNSFEFRLDGTWQVARGGVITIMKQNSYCSYRLSDRRPTFP